MNLFKGGNLNSQRSENLALGSFWFFKSIITVAAVFALFGMGQEARAQQAGALDPNFVNGRANGANDSVFDIVVQPDGKSIILGNFTEYNAVPRINGIARVNMDGSLDATFNPSLGVNDKIFSVALQSDGKIIATGGIIDPDDGDTHGYVFVRLNIDGSLDTSFNIGTGANNYINAIAIQSSGKIIIGGSFTSYNGTAINRIARINTDGSLDTSFTVGTGTDAAMGIVLLPGDGMLIYGSFTSYNGVTINDIARLSSDGVLDSSFSTGTGISYGVKELVVQPDNKILVNSNGFNYNGAWVHQLFRINWDGTLDNTFQSQVSDDEGGLQRIALQPDGKILLGGSFYLSSTYYRRDVVRLNSDGTTDASFYLEDDGYNWETYSLAIQADGKVLIGGNFTAYLGGNTVERNCLVRLNDDGTIDASYNPFPGLDNFSEALAVQSDGKILVSGSYSVDNATIKSGIFRFNADGTLDTSFILGSGISSSGFYKIVIHSNGNIFAGGAVGYYNGVAIGNIVALLPNGTINPAFQTGTGFNGSILDMVIQPNGQIIVVGSFNSYNGATVNRVARLNTDGSLDTSFNSGAGPGNTVYSVALQSDGKIIIGGDFTSFDSLTTMYVCRDAEYSCDNPTFIDYNNGGAACAVDTVNCDNANDCGTSMIGFTDAVDACGYSQSVSRLVRLNTDGSLDSSFNPGSNASNRVKKIGILSDGGIIIAGDFYNSDTMTHYDLKRLNPRGALVNFFDDSPYWRHPNSIAIQADDKIIVGGNSSEGSFSVGYLDRLNPDGSQDNTFLNFGFSDDYDSHYGEVNAVAIQNNDKLIVGGLFQKYGNSSVLNLTKLELVTIVVLPTITTQAPTNVLLTTATGVGNVVDNGAENPTRSIEWGTTSGVYTNSCSAGVGGFGTYSCSMTGLTQGTTYYVRAVATNSAGTSYGSEVTFQTATLVAPTITTNAVTNINTVTATANGSIVSTGYENPTRSMEWGTVSGTYTNSCSAGIGGVGNYSCAMTGLTQGTTYYVRAVATNSAGTSYGSEVTFQTATIVAPTVSTNAVASIGQTTATANGSIVSTGYENPTRSMEWGTVSGTYSNSCSAGIGGTGNYSCAMTGLTADTTYYVRAKATNSAGTGYGSEVSFKTNVLPPLPDLANGTVSVIVSQSDGKTLIGGAFTSYNGIAINRIARLNVDGTLDTSFNVGTGANSSVYAIAVQSDGKIIIGGYFTNYNGTTINRLARLNADGTLDTTFTVGSGANNYVRTISIQADGKIVIGGDFTSFSGVTKNRITRLNADGALDATFTGTGAGSYVYASAVQTDGKILIGGAFTTYSGTTINRIARLNDDGTLDATFTVGTGAGSTIRTMFLQSDGKIMIGGEFTTYNGTTRTRLARLNADGTLDTAFVSTVGANSVVYTTAVQSDGKIIIGGSFTTYNSTSRVRIARVNTNGTLDTTFVVGTGANGTVYSSVVKSDGSIIIGGDFTTYNSVSKNRIAFINADGTINPAIPPVSAPEVATTAVTAINAITATANGSVISIGNESPNRYVEWSTTSGIYTNSCSAGVGGIGAFSCSMTGLTQSTTYYVRAKAVNSAGIVYGDEVSFQTQTIVPPTLTTTAPSSITGISATGNGNVSDVGYENPTREIEWGTESGVYTSSCSAGVGATGAYSCAMTGLSLNTTYYVRAKATNSAGTSYGSEITFTTINIPTVTTQDASAITAIYATGNGAIVNTGGANPTRYIEWGTVSGTYTNSCNAGTGATGVYACTMTGFTPNTTYYFRAKATNVAGTGYGEEVSFQTAPITVANVTTNAASSITGNTAIGNGNITYTGGDNPTRYIEWGTTSGVYTNSCSAGTGAAGTYNCAMTGLSNYTTYYVRAKATNSIGTSYGNEVTFTTSVAIDLANSAVAALATQSDGKIIAGGNFTSYNGVLINRLIRLNVDGTLDTSFNPGTGADMSIQDIAIQSDGKIIICGSFTTYNGAGGRGIARLNTDGTLDTTFNVGTGINSGDYVRTIDIQPADGKVIIGGRFTSYNGVARNRIARLNTDGSLDTTFNPGTGAQDIVLDSALQSDGKIVIVGYFTAYNGTAINRIARLNTDGTLDTTFSVGTGFTSYSVQVVTVQSDGKILAGGEFSLFNGAAANRIARLNSDGTLDTTFTTTGTGFNSSIYSMAIQSDGKIIIGGGYTNYNGISRNRIARVNSDGSLDTTFNPGTGTNYEVNAIEAQSDGKIVIGGQFTTYNGLSRKYIARINADGTGDDIFGEVPRVSFLSTSAVSGVLAASATGNGNILSTGGDNPERIIEWGTTSGVYTNSCTAGTGNIGAYSCDMTGLTPTTTYYARAKAVNIYGISYGSEVTFTTVALALPAVTSQATTTISATTALGNGNVTSVGGENPQRFIEWGTTSGVYTSSCSAGTGSTGVYSCAMTNISPYSTYYVRAKIINSVGTVYGSETSFTNRANLIEEVITNEYQGAGTAQTWRADDSAWTYTLPFTFNYYGTNYSTIKVSSNGYICLNTAYACTSYTQTLTGTNNGPIIAALARDLYTNTLAENDIFITENVDNVVIRWNASSSSVVVNFEIVLYSNGNIKFNYGPQTAALATGSVVGISYGDGFTYTPSVYNSFTNFNLVDTSSWTAAPITVPAITTVAASNITINSAGLNGNVTDSGNDYVTREVEWGIVSGTYSNTCSTGAGGEGIYRCNISGLIPNTTYYYRAKATNSAGTVYGSEMSFQTLDILAPVVTTGAASRISSVNARLNANIITTGNEKPIREIEWGIASGAYTNSCNLGVGDAGGYSCSADNLTSNTTYYFRAKATNSAETVYGSELSFQTRRSDAAGEIDPGFFKNISSGFNGHVSDMVIQPDGKTIFIGNFDTYGGVLRNDIARLNTDGTLDETFNSGSGVENDEYIGCVAIQSDGKMIITGSFTSYNGSRVNQIVRLNSDGKLDTTFDSGTGLGNGGIYSLAVQSDDKVIIGGNFLSYNGVSRKYLLRLNSDGSVDASFNFGTGFNGLVREVYIQPDGKIIIGGEFTSYNATTANRVARLNGDGTLDGTFSSGTVFSSDYVQDIKMQPDGKILLATYYYASSISYGRIFRLETNGAVDASFAFGAGVSGNFYSISLQSDGKVIVGGLFYWFHGIARDNIARLNADGTTDTTFDPGPRTKNNNYVSITAIQSDGKILAGGYFYSYSGRDTNNIVRFNPDSTIDTNFKPNTAGLSMYIDASLIQPDGKIVISGDFRWFSNVSNGHIVRLNADGTLDNTFNSDIGADDEIEIVAIQPDGKLLIGGWFDAYDGIARKRIARLNVDGSLDTSFDPGTGANGAVYEIGVQSDGKIIIGGEFTSYNGTASNRIARLNTDGTLDTSFAVGTGFNGSVYGLHIQSDGKILAGGYFGTYNGISVNIIARLNTDGTLDSSFVSEADSGDGVDAIAVQSDGKIIIAGNIDNYGGEIRNSIARINTDGTLDTSFDPGSGFESLSTFSLYFQSIVVQSDGRILVGGFFDSYDGAVRTSIARLNTDGSVDNNFSLAGAIDIPPPDESTYPDNSVDSILIQSDGKILVGGSFSNFNGVPTGYLTRVFSGDSIAAPTLPSTAPTLSTITSNFAIATSSITATGGEDPLREIEWGTVSGTYTNSCSAGVGGTGDYSCNMTSLTPETTYFVRGKATNSAGVSHTIETSFTTLANVGPQLILPTPSNNAADVQVDINIVSKFDRVVEKGNGKIHIKKKSDDSIIEEIDVEDTNITGWGTDTLTIDPTNDLPGNTEIYINIDPTALVDTLGNYFFGISDNTTWTFTTENITAEGPQIVTPYPTDNATNISPDSNLTISFDRPVEAGTGNIDIINATDDSTIETIDITSPNVTGWGTDTLTINPTNNLPSNTPIYINVDATAIRDTLGNFFFGITDNSTWTFTTGSTVGPQIILPTPANNAANVSVDTNIVSKFDRVVEKGNGKIHIKKKSDDSIIEEIDVEDTNITGWSTDTLTINPTNDLPGNTEIYINIEPTALVDSLGNYFFGITDNTTWTFTTEYVGPQIITPTPADNATNIDPTADLTISFDRTVEVGTGNIDIINATDDSTIETIDITSPNVTGWGTDTLTINPTNNLPSNTEIYINIDPTAIVDTLGNFFFGITDNSTWTFTTENITTEGPQIVTPYPTDDATNIALDADLVINFDRPVEPGTGTIDIIETEDNSIIEEIDVNSDNITGWGTDTLTINPTDNLPADTNIHVNIEPGAILDTLGNYFFGINDNSTWSFRTGNASTVGPQLILPTPANNSTNISPDADLITKFDRPVYPGIGNFHIKNKEDNTEIETIDVNSSSITGWGTDTLTIDPTNDLPVNTEVYITIDSGALKDVSGSFFFGITDSSTWTFITGDIDNDLAVEIINVKDIQKDKVKVRVEVEGNNKGDEKFDFKVEIKNKDNDTKDKVKIKKVKVSEADKATLEISQLLPNTSYSLAVSVSEVGEDDYSKASDSKSITTLEDLEKLKDTLTETQPVTNNLEDTLITNEEERQVENQETPTPVVNSLKEDDNDRKDKKETISAAITTTLAVIGLIPALTNAFATTTIPFIPLTPGVLRAPFLLRLFNASRRKFLSALRFFPILTISSNDKRSIPFDRKENNKFWGVVFDSYTKQPIMDAVVYLVSLDKKRVIEHVVTDEQGRYGFLIGETGKYALEVKKGIYQIANLTQTDSLYGNIYTQPIDFQAGDLFHLNVALTAPNFNWHKFSQDVIRRYNSFFFKFLSYLLDAIYVAGMILSIYNVIYYPSFFNYLALAFYIGLLIFRVIFKDKKKFGIVSKKETKSPLPFTVVALHDIVNKQRLNFAVTDVLGRYYLLAKNGSYALKLKYIDMTGGSYEKEGVANVEKGIFKKDFEV